MDSELRADLSERARFMRFCMSVAAILFYEKTLFMKRTTINMGKLAPKK